MPGQVGAPVAPVQHRVRFENLDREMECAADETLFQAARRSAIRIVGACGGRGVCGTCLVRIRAGEVEPIEGAAGGSSGQRFERDGWLRSCQLHPQSDCVLELAPRSVAPVVRSEVDGQGPSSFRPAPAVSTLDVALTPPTLRDVRSDATRLLEALHGTRARRVDLGALRSLPGMLRTHVWSVRAVVYGDEVIGVFPPGTRPLGLAIDMGTTNVAGFLFDLATGTRLATLGIENPQAGYGADLVSRLNHSVRTLHGARDLRTAAVTAIGEMARDLCDAVAAHPEEIVDIAVGGNTVMHHALFELPMGQLGRAPFVPAAGTALTVRARELGLAVAPGARIYSLPNIGGFVGGDHVAALLATEQRWRLGTTIVMDIGTNTEISLIHNDQIRTVSAPSGPAFEGGHVSSGMRAAEGAIEYVRIDGGRIVVKTIGDTEPVGICGSGVLDAMAALLEVGAVNPRGALQPGHPVVCSGREERVAVLAPGVLFTQGDVRAVQLAKAAIRSGIDLLLREAGIEEQDLDQVVIAGAFGTYINVESAVVTGMLPALPIERYVQVGNAAGVGVRMALTSTVFRERAERLVSECQYIELGSLDGFQHVFMNNIGFERVRHG
jgi:uncharacterized 2Fe-2S/4Fe-4S cluster protein (DUF4445 family)